MDFWFEVETPANTAKEKCTETKIKLTEGYIRQVWIVHPDGCVGLAHATVWEGGHQLFPTNAEKSYHGNGTPMTWNESYYLEAPAELVLKTWNEDDTYDHYVYVRITILREKLDPVLEALLVLINLIKRLLGLR